MFNSKTICIVSISHPKVSYTKGESYDYYKNEDLYIILSDKGYMRTFNEENFNIYFSSIAKTRNNKLNKLGL